MGTSIKFEFDDEFLSEIRRVIQEELSSHKVPNQPDIPMSVEETAKMFKVTVQTIYSWLKKEAVPSSIIGGRRYFFLNQIKEHIQTKNKPTQSG